MSLTLPEGVTAEQANPQPPYFPQCADPKCETPFILRLCYSLTGGRKWVWQRDCKHDKRRPQPAIVIADLVGQIVQEVDA